MDINIEMQLKEQVSANPQFESDVSRFIHTYWATASPIAEWQLWNKDFFGLQGNRIGWSRRGKQFDILGGNNLGVTYPKVDYLKGGVVGSIKSTRVIDSKQIEKIVRNAYKEMIKALKTDPNLKGATSAEVKIIVPSGTSHNVVEAIEKTSKQIHAQNPGIKFNAPKIVKGIPGNAGTFLKGMGIVGGFFSAVQLPADIEKGDIASVIGSGSAAGATMLEIGSGVLSSSALSISAAVVGAFALGYGAGTLINNYLIPIGVQDAIGGTIAQIVDHGWTNIKEFYFGR